MSIEDPQNGDSPVLLAGQVVRVAGAPAPHSHLNGRLGVVEESISGGGNSSPSPPPADQGGDGDGERQGGSDTVHVRMFAAALEGDSVVLPRAALRIAQDPRLTAAFVYSRRANAERDEGDAVGAALADAFICAMGDGVDDALPGARGGKALPAGSGLQDEALGADAKTECGEDAGEDDVEGECEDNGETIVAQRKVTLSELHGLRARFGFARLPGGGLLRRAGMPVAVFASPSAARPNLLASLLTAGEDGGAGAAARGTAFALRLTARGDVADTSANELLRLVFLAHDLAALAGRRGGALGGEAWQAVRACAPFYDVGCRMREQGLSGARTMVRRAGGDGEGEATGFVPDPPDMQRTLREIG